jgi:penicillin-binding protein 1C
MAGELAVAPSGTPASTRVAIEAPESATAPIRFRQPTDGLELAFDPRLPAAAQAFRFLLDGVAPDDTVAWSIDEITESHRGPSLIWPVTRGVHRVAAEIHRDGQPIAELSPVEFRVR